ncbi:DHH family phosphoesterase [Bacillus sp. FSL R10-2789]|uniref:DHH family phosphoesterase n=1 Tax=Bacillus sp. FSL R10-2789 TaxID=2954662 RepID=UPI0030FCD879
MKIKQIGSYNGDIISTILENRKIEDIDLFLNPTSDDDLDTFSLSNMKQGAEVVLAHLMINNNIGILVDPDADGYSSSSVIYQYIKKVKPEANIIYFLHDSKAHGLTEKILDQVSQTELDLLIIPDAGSNDDEGIARLYHMGLDIVIIDHHEVEKEPRVGILINNQLDYNEATNRNLVGVGMALKFCQALDKMLSVNFSEDFYDLVAIGQIGDASDISQNEVRNMVFRGLGEMKNPFVIAVLEDHFGSLDKIAPKDLSFSIIPLINAVVRVGTMEEKTLLFRALNGIDSSETWVVKKKKKNKQTGKFDSFEVEQNLYEYARDICKKVKTRQAGMVKKTMLALESDIDNTGGIAIGVLETSEQGSITGLVANKIASKLQKPVLLVHHVNGKYVGSGRGYEKVLPSLKDWCNESGLVEFAQGHANAFGISIFEEKFDAFKEKLKDVKGSEFVYEVDLLTRAKVDKEAILQVEENKYLFGGKCREPLFAFTGIPVNKQFIRQRGQMLTFFENGVEFVMYGAPAGLFESLTMNFDRIVTMDFVGRPSVNTWGGRSTPQLVLEDCERNETPIPVEEEVIAEVTEVTAETIVF